MIIGGQDTCQGDSGGPLWVEEDGVGLTNDTDPEEAFVSTFFVFSHFGWTGCQGKRLCKAELPWHLHEVRHDESF